MLVRAVQPLQPLLRALSAAAERVTALLDRLSLARLQRLLPYLQQMHKVDRAAAHSDVLLPAAAQPARLRGRSTSPARRRTAPK